MDNAFPSSFGSQFFETWACLLLGMLMCCPGPAQKRWALGCHLLTRSRDPVMVQDAVCGGRCDRVSRDITGAGCWWHRLFRLSSVENSCPSLPAVEQSHRLHLVHFQKPKRGAEGSRPVWVRGCWFREVGERGWGLQPLAGAPAFPQWEVLHSGCAVCVRKACSHDL